MNKNRIFAIFILIALLISCVGVSFASDDFDDSNVGGDYLSQDDIDDVDDDSDDDSDDSDDDWEDSEDDDSWDDDDWEDYDDDDSWDDDSWDEFDEGNELVYSNGNYYPHLVHKTAYATGSAYAKQANGCGNDSYDDQDVENETSSYENSTEVYLYGSINLDAYLPESDYDSSLPASTGQNSVAKTLNFPDMPEDSLSSDSNTSVENNVSSETAVVDANDNLGIFALLALLLVSILVII